MIDSKELKGETLCSNNSRVKYYLMGLRKVLKKNGVASSEILEIIQDSLDTLKVMKKQGQKLENRLRLWRVFSEKMGFRRYKNGKIQEKLR